MIEGATPRSAGELPWRTSFGSGLHLLRHLRNDAVLAELARIHVRDCPRRWIPAAELVEVAATQDGATLQLKVRFRAFRNAGSAATVSEVSLTISG